jgi:hypothetical protein
VTKEQQTNGYEDSDFRQILDEIEGFEGEKLSIRMTAASECGKIAKRIKNAKATAKALGIPLSILNASLKSRKLERQLQAIAEDIPEDLAEVWVDAAGQFSMFKPEEADEADDTPEEAPAVTKAARKTAKAAAANAAREQEEGADELNKLAAVH